MSELSVLICPLCRECKPPHQPVCFRCAAGRLATNDDRYPYVRVWGAMMGAMSFLVQQQQAAAAAMHAPANTIIVYDKTEVGPALAGTTDDILSAHIRAKFEDECRRLGVPSPWADQPF